MLLSKEEIISQAMQYKNYTGVYFLIRSNRIVYIGSSFKINKRLMTQYGGNIKFDSCSFIEVKTDKVLRLRAMEAEYILKYKPLYNITIPSNEKYININNGLPPEIVKINNKFKVDLLRQKGFELIEFESENNFGLSLRRYYYDSKIKNKIRLCLIKNFNIIEERQRKYIELKKQIDQL